MSELKVVSLEECLEKVIDYRGRTPKKLGKDWLKDGEYRAISANNVKFDGLIREESIYRGDEELYKLWMKDEVERGDILLTSEAPSGQAMIWNSDEKIILSQRLYALRVNKNLVDNNYLKYFIQSPIGQKSIVRNNSGSTVSGISAKTFKNIKILIPDLEKQQAISKILLAIDQKIQINNQINQELEAMAKTLYDYWFVQFDFPDQNGKPYKSSGGKMVYHPELKREIPEGWGVESVGNLLDKVTKAEKIENNSIEFIGEIPVIDQSQKYIAGFTNNEKALLQPQDGHVIFGDHTRVVKYINFDYARGADGTQVLISNNENISNVLLYHMIEDFDLSNYGYARHFKFLKEKTVIVPDKEVSSKFETQANVIYEKIKNNIFENQELTQLRDWLLPMLMNGQVKVE